MDFDNDTTEHRDVAEALVEEHGWKDVFPLWFDYLKCKCPTEKDVINFANLFFYYGGAERPIRNPYPFISYLYYRVDTAKYGRMATDIFDRIVIPLLSNIGDINIENDPDYVPEKDQRILAKVKEWEMSN